MKVNNRDRRFHLTWRGIAEVICILAILFYTASTILNQATKVLPNGAYTICMFITLIIVSIYLINSEGIFDSIGVFLLYVILAVIGIITLTIFAFNVASFPGILSNTEVTYHSNTLAVWLKAILLAIGFDIMITLYSYGIKGIWKIVRMLNL